MAPDVHIREALGVRITLDWQHLFDAARVLAGGSGATVSPGRPRQAMLKRAVSTTYYGMFHALCASNADAFVGASPPGRDLDLWVQAYRALDHRPAKDRLASYRQHSPMPEIRDFANLFGSLQANRLDADYNPRSVFTRSQVIRLINRAEAVTDAFVNIAARQRRLLATHLLVGRSRG